MNRYLKIGMLASLLVIVMGRVGLAQDPSDNPNIFDAIKAQMTSSVRENKRLAQENRTLRVQFIGLQLEVDWYKQELGISDSEYSGYAAKKISHDKDGSPAGWDGLGEDRLIREAQEIYLSGRSMDLDEQQRLRELQLYDLQYMKQELQLELKAKELEYQKIGKEQGSELDALKDAIKKAEAREKELSLKIAEEKAAVLVYPRKIKLLKAENIMLRNRIGRLKRLFSR